MRRPHNRCRVCCTRHYPMCRDEERWPLEALLVKLRHDVNPLDLFTVSGATFARWQAEGLETFHADRLAYRAGFHPVQVWGWEWVEAGLSVVDRQRLDGGWRQAWLWLERGAEQMEEAA